MKTNTLGLVLILFFLCPNTILAKTVGTRSFHISDQSGHARVIELAASGLQIPHAQQCLESALQGAKQSLYGMNAKDAPKAKRSQAAGQIRLDIKGYEGSCPQSVKSVHGELKILYVDNLGNEYPTKGKCQSSNQGDSNLYLRILTFRYERSKPQLVNVQQLKLNSFNMENSEQNSQQYMSCRHWTQRTVQGRQNTPTRSIASTPDENPAERPNQSPIDLLIGSDAETKKTTQPIPISKQSSQRQARN